MLLMAGKIRRNSAGKILRHTDGDPAFQGSEDCVPADLCTEEDPNITPTICVDKDDLPGSATVFEYNGACYDIDPADPAVPQCDLEKLPNIDGLTTHANCAACGTLCATCTYNLPATLQFTVSGVDPLFSCMDCPDVFSTLESRVDLSDITVDGVYTVDAACGVNVAFGGFQTENYCCETADGSGCGCDTQTASRNMSLSYQSRDLPSSGNARLWIHSASNNSGFYAFDQTKAQGVNDCWDDTFTNQLTEECTGDAVACGTVGWHGSDSGTVTVLGIWP